MWLVEDRGRLSWGRPPPAAQGRVPPAAWCHDSGLAAGADRWRKSPGEPRLSWACAGDPVARRGLEKAQGGKGGGDQGAHTAGWDRGERTVTLQVGCIGHPPPGVVSSSAEPSCVGAGGPQPPHMGVRTAPSPVWWRCTGWRLINAVRPRTWMGGSRKWLP